MSQAAEAQNEAYALRADQFALKVIAMRDAGLNQTEIARRLKLTRQRISQILQRAKKRGLIDEGEGPNAQGS